MKLWAALCGIAPLLAGVPASADGLPAVPYLQVMGHGEVKVVPDMLNIALTVTQVDAKLAVARADVEKRSNAVIALAKRLGIAKPDIQAQAIYVAPEYSWQNNKREYAGQRVTRTFSLILRNLDRYPALLDGLVKAGISSVDSVTASRSDMAVLRTRALTAAMQDAAARGETLASSAHAELGKVFSITETGDNFPGPRPMMASAGMRGAAATSAVYEPGLVSVSADVSVVYLLTASQ